MGFNRKSDIYWLIAIIAIFLIAIFSSGIYGLWLIFILLAVTFLFTLKGIVTQCIGMSKKTPEHFRNISLLKLISKFILLFLTSGTFLYVLTFLTIERESLQGSSPSFFSNTELFFRSLICSFDLFLLDIDSNIIDRIDNHPDLKTWIFIQAILSALCTAGMFLSLIISRISAHWRLSVNSKITDKKSHLYLFFGLNRTAEILAKDILKNDGKALLILIDEPNISEEDRDVFQNLISYFGHKGSSFSFADNIGALIGVSNINIGRLSGKIGPDETTDVFRLLGLTKISGMINELQDDKLSSPELHIFFLDDNQDKNILDLMTVAKDNSILKLDKNKVKTAIYCHARKTGLNSFFEELGFRKNLNIKIIDSSHLSVEKLKLDGKYHPVNLMEISRKIPGTISSSLNCLIVGFGEVGRDALRFLYEFGAFVSEDSTLENAIRAPFECICVDPHMKDLKGGFKISAPSLFENNPGISLIESSTNDSEFFTDVLNCERSKKLNYIVIATGNDDENINIAIRIFRHLRSQGNSMDNLRILVKCREGIKFELMTKFARFYNSTFNSDNPTEIINIFGEPESIFTYDLIIGDVLEKEAIRFYDRYALQSSSTVTWQERRKRLTSFPLSLDNLQKLFRQESQDFENALHAYTKTYILVNSLGRDYDWSGFIHRYFKPDGEPDQEGSRNNIIYPRLSAEENQVVLNLAKLEHLRWNASHELLGYRPCKEGEDQTRCDERKKSHNCLVPWDLLDLVSEKSSDMNWQADYKIYDFYVVDTTISLNTKYLLELPE